MNTNRRLSASQALKTPFNVPSALILLLLLVLVAGCSPRSFQVELADNEAIAPGAVVFLDRKPVGTVSQMTRQGQARVARFVITDRTVQMRTGVERERRGGMDFSSASVPAGAPALKSGATLPTRAPMMNFAKSTAQSAHQFVYQLYALHSTVVTVVVLVVAVLAALFLLRLLRKAVWLLLLLFGALSLVAASSSLGFSREQLRIDQKGFDGAIQRAGSDLHEARQWLGAGVAGLAERSLVSAMIALDAVGVRMAGHEERVRALKPAALAYSRENQIKILLANATEMRARVGQLQQEVEVLFAESKAGRVGEWGGVTMYKARRAEFIRRFQTRSLSPENLVNDIKNLQGIPVGLILSELVTQNAAGWQEVGPDLWRSPSGQDFTEGGKALSKPKLAALPQAAAPTKPSDTPGATATGVPAVQVLRPMVVYVTNVVERSIPGPTITKTQFITNTVILVTNAPTASNAAASRAAPVVGTGEALTLGTPTSTNRGSYAGQGAPTKEEPASNLPPRADGWQIAAGTHAPPSVTNEQIVSAPENRKASALTQAGARPRSRSVQRIQTAKAILAGTIFLVLTMLLIIGLVAHVRKRPMRVFLHGPSGEEHEVLLLSAADVAILRAPPAAAPAELRGSEPAIGRDRFGRPILLASEGAMINGIPISGKPRLHPGDEVTLGHPDSPATWAFEGITTLEFPTLEPEPETTA